MVAQTAWLYAGAVVTVSVAVGLYNQERTRNLLGSIGMGIAVLSLGGMGAVLASLAIGLWFVVD
ncbi:MAG: hypothetical protein AMXMBFR7_50400 [Planctomycetota bacterium]